MNTLKDKFTFVQVLTKRLQAVDTLGTAFNLNKSEGSSEGGHGFDSGCGRCAAYQAPDVVSI